MLKKCLSLYNGCVLILFILYQMTTRFQTTTTTNGKSKLRSMNMISMKYLSRQENKTVKETSRESLPSHLNLQNTLNDEEEKEHSTHSIR